MFENHLTERDSNYGLKLQQFFHREYFFPERMCWEARVGRRRDRLVIWPTKGKKCTLLTYFCFTLVRITLEQVPNKRFARKFPGLKKKYLLRFMLQWRVFS